LGTEMVLNTRVNGSLTTSPRRSGYNFTISTHQIARVLHATRGERPFVELERNAVSVSAKPAPALSREATSDTKSI
jgi:hypothetical protein